MGSARQYARSVRAFTGSGLDLILLATLLLATLLLPVTVANAQASSEPGEAQASSEPAACLATLVVGDDAVPLDWRAVVDAEAGWAALLPPSHQVRRSDDIWYIFETLDGAPLVPDVAVQFHRDQSVEEAAVARFGEAVVLEPVRMGPATLGYRVSVRPDAGAEGYLVATEGGVYTISRYEGFDWEGFDRVACSFHLVEQVEGVDGADVLD